MFLLHLLSVSRSMGEICRLKKNILNSSQLINSLTLKVATEGTAASLFASKWSTSSFLKVTKASSAMTSMKFWPRSSSKSCKKFVLIQYGHIWYIRGCQLGNTFSKVDSIGQFFKSLTAKLQRINMCY